MDEVSNEKDNIQSDDDDQDDFFEVDEQESQKEQIEDIVSASSLTDLTSKLSVTDENTSTNEVTALGSDSKPILDTCHDMNSTLTINDTSTIPQNGNVENSVKNLVPNVCTACTYRNETKIASMYCEQCKENLCDTCVKIHKSRSATKQHMIMELKSPETSDIVKKHCIPCKYRDQTNDALWFCNNCDENLCETCYTEHKMSSATSGHGVSSLQEITMVKSIECDVCKIDGTSAKGSLYCEICEENLCEKCVLNHKRRKATKGHNLLDLQRTEQKQDNCDVCKIKGEVQVALQYCDECEENLCQLCTDQHKTRKATAKHILIELESCSLNSSEFDDTAFSCDPCEQMKQHSYASSFCESCTEFLCPSCVQHHKKMKATSSHIVNDVRGDRALSNLTKSCDPCSVESNFFKAQFYCRVCEEYFCPSCSKQHRSFKATKDHKQVNLKEETVRLLSNKSHCNVCKMDGINKNACLFCDLCDEAYCSPCAKSHSSQTATRHHELIDVDKSKYESMNEVQFKYDIDTTKHQSKVPGKPIMEDVTTNSIRIRWSCVDISTKLPTHYDIRYKEENDSKWFVHSTETCRELETIRGLKCYTEYRFKVRAVYGESESKDSPVSDIIKTKLSLARKVKEYALPIQSNTGSPEIYKVPIKEQMSCRNEHAKTRRCVFGESKPGVLEKTIMVVGATGAGKSTLIEGMVNYIFDVSWEDDFRFSIIDLMEEEKEKINDQTISQTEWITCYKLNWVPDCQIYYTLNIIDTPGFGDTRGIERDRRVVEQIRELFTLTGDQGISTIDGICFITQAPLARLTAPQKYIIDSILSIFGLDIMENIFGLITFADGKTPPVLEALKTADVPIVKTFVFNNSALFEPNKGIGNNSFSPMFWNMGKKSFASFFKHLTGMKSASLQLTSEVLQERRQLETLVEGLRPQINEGLSVLETLRQERTILKRHERDIRENKDFTYSIDKTCQRKIDLEPGIHVTNCLVCNRTCHENCRIADDNQKNRCVAMKDGVCRICPKHCVWQEHKNNPYKFEFYTEKVQSTYKELQARYKTAQIGVSKQKQIVDQIMQQVLLKETYVQSMIEKMRVTINRISTIALKPNPLSSVEYIDLLIDAEKQEAKPGYRSRMQALEKFREDALLMQNVPNQNYKPLGDITEYMDKPETSDQNNKGLKQKLLNFFLK